MFSIEGRPVDTQITEERRERASVTWWEPAARLALRRRGRILPRGIAGDGSVLLAAIRDEQLGLTFQATAEGPTFLADLDDPRAAFVQLSSYFEPGYEVSGQIPEIDAGVPEGANP